MAGLKVVSLLVLCLVVAAPLAESAVNCGQVASSVAPCLGYMRGGGAVPPPCCGGIRSLNAACKTTADRQTACRCLQSASRNIKGLNLGLVAGLPGKCGLNIPYKISPSTDCSRVR